VKTIIKHKTTDKTSSSDATLYESAFTNAVQSHVATTMSFKVIVDSLSIEQLQEMFDYIKFNKTTKNLKLAHLAMMCPAAADMLKVQQKLALATENVSELIQVIKAEINIYENQYL
jgi:hypothetical protein